MSKIKCDVCGRFIPYNDLDRGVALRVMVTPETDFSYEEYETLCKDHLHARQQDTRITQLEQELAEARKDSERLEWLFERGLAWRDCYGEDWKEGEWLYMKHHARLTIDEAMKGGER